MAKKKKSKAPKFERVPRTEEVFLVAQREYKKDSEILKLHGEFKDKKKAMATAKTATLLGLENLDLYDFYIIPVTKVFTTYDEVGK